MASAGRDEEDREAAAGGSAIPVPRALTDVLEASPDGMAILDRSGRVLAANRALAEVLGIPVEELPGREVEQVIRGLALASRGVEAEQEARVVRPTGDEVPVEVWLGTVGEPEGATAITVRDVSERKLVEDRLRQLSDHDPLTGLLNRRRFELDAEKEHARSARYGGGAMLVLALDDFKDVNDALGHRCGDELLREVAAMISERVRETDVVARLGGDVFAVLLGEVDAEGAQAIGEEIVTLIADRRFELDGHEISTKLSCGVVALDAGAADADEALSWAELTMRRAKAMGGGRVVVFDRSLIGDEDSRLSWRERIRAALDSDAFVPHFQPILDLEDNTVRNWEVLIRMRDERGELIPPDSFVPTAERLGLIRELDRVVVSKAIEALRAHPEPPDLSLEVNLSGRSIGDPRMMEAIRSGLAESGVDPRRIIFEVTETAAIANLEEAARFGQELLDLGCGFALDDFGTGFASFYYLKRLPLSHLKIDGDFIRGLVASPIDQLVVKAMVEIAHGMGVKTIAEYVEDTETVAQLRELGVDYCQGFEVGRPGPPQPPDRIPREE